MKPTPAEITPHGEYRRSLPGADFSLEHSTQAVPERTGFYLLQGGQAVFSTQDFGEAVAAYRGMCREFWRDRLHSRDPEQRVASAWGLLGLNPDDNDAKEVIRIDGNDAARKRLEQIRRRVQAERRHGRRRSDD